MIVKESPTRKRGRKAKYDFSSLMPGDCLKVKAIGLDAYRNVMGSLIQFKKRNAPNWETTTRFDNGIVSVYRLK